jgi:hypothetical protein
MSCSSRLEKTCAGDGESRMWHSSLQEVICLGFPQHLLRSSQHWVPTVNVVTCPIAGMNILRVIPHPSVVYPQPRIALVDG